MTILKHEVRSGLAGCILWSAVTGGLMALCVSMYPSMSGSMDDFSAMFANMGDFSAAFGLDKLEFGSVMGFYGTECGNILGLGGAFYAALTAMGLLAGEEGGHTAEFLLTHPVSRVRAAAEKLAALAVLVLAGAGWWFLFVAAGLGSAWLLTGVALWKRRNPMKAIAWLLAVVPALVLAWDWRTGFMGWSINFVLPCFIPCMQLAAAGAARILRLRPADYLRYLSICMLAGFFILSAVV